MKKVKIGLVMFVVLSLVLLLAACGGNGSGTVAIGSSETKALSDNSGSKNNKSSTVNFNGKPVSAEDVFKLGEIPGLGIIHTEKKGLKIGMTVASLEFPVFQAMRDFVKIQAEADGNKLIFENGENDINKQAAAVDNFITQKVDVVIFNAANPKAQKGALDKLHSAGIPVVIMDRAFDDKESVQVLGNDYQEGRNATETILQKLGGKGNVVHITGQPGVSHAIDNAKGFTDVLSEKGSGIKVVAEQSGNYLRDKAFSVMQDILNANPKGTIQAVFAHNDTMALGVIPAIEAAGRIDEIIVIGGDGDKDALEAVKNGKMFGTNDRSPHIIGAVSYQAAAAILNGKKSSLPYAVLIPPVMITKDTMNRVDDPFFALEKGKKEVFKTYEEFIPRLIKK
jgi:ribose transport system substrate-binding protein